MKQHDQNLRTLLGAIDTVMQSAKEADLPETEALLRLARLDLLMRAHGVAADDLPLIYQLLSRGAGAVSRAPTRRKKAVARPLR